MLSPWFLPFSSLWVLLGPLSSCPSGGFIPGLSPEAAQEGGKESHPGVGVCRGCRCRSPRSKGQAGKGTPRCHPSPLQPPNSTLNPGCWEGGVKGGSGLSGGTKGPPCSLLLRTSWDPVSHEEAASCPAPRGLGIGPRLPLPRSLEKG